MYTCLSKAHGNIMEFKYHLEIGTSLKAGALVSLGWCKDEEEDDASKHAR